MNPLCFWNKGFLLSTENFLENKQNTFFYFGAKTEHRRLEVVPRLFRVLPNTQEGANLYNVVLPKWIANKNLLDLITGRSCYNSG